MIPSISAITGVTPERYIWRTCIALHCTPRFAIGFIYYNWYHSKIHLIVEEKRQLFLKLIRINFWLYTVENACLVGVAYISNKENYRECSCCALCSLFNQLQSFAINTCEYFTAVHEKIFVTFMITALFYEFLTLVLIRWTQPVMDKEVRHIIHYVYD